MPDLGLHKQLSPAGGGGVLRNDPRLGFRIEAFNALDNQLPRRERRCVIDELRNDPVDLPARQIQPGWQLYF